MQESPSTEILEEAHKSVRKLRRGGIMITLSLTEKRGRESQPPIRVSERDLMTTERYERKKTQSREEVRKKMAAASITLEGKVLYRDISGSWSDSGEHREKESVKAYKRRNVS